jgi:aminopeptidase N
VRAPWDGGFVWAKTKSGKPWIATAVQGEGCDLFWPCIDHPSAEPGAMDIRITVPAGLAAPSNGGARRHQPCRRRPQHLSLAR